jgi:adenine-specific DNA-methyltransferase
MVKQNYNKLELTWIGKGEEPKLEPRILIENPEYSYGDPKSENMLIYGDNLLALKALEQDFAGKIKCIYIDPPYNTGSAFDKYDDGIEHSIWLSLMRLRIKLLRALLNEQGIIFISIDDHEIAYLQVLMDEVFGRGNFLVNMPTIMNLKGNQDQFGFAGTHEYTLCYAKNKSKVKLNQFPVSDEDVLNDWMEDDIGLYKKGATLKSTGEESNREDRPKMFYPILVKNNAVFSISDEEFECLYNKENKCFNDEYLEEITHKYSKQHFEIILPFKTDVEYGRWRWGFDSFKTNYSTEIIVTKGRTGISLYKKQRPSLGEVPTSKPKSLFYKPEYSSGNGTSQIKALFGHNAFPYPKPEDLIKDLLIIGSDPGDFILDSFLGSGTTAAVAHKMGRKWIGIELGEHAKTHCCPRLKAVVNGEQGGISKATDWKGGGGFKFYTLAPSLLNEDKYGNWIISKEYNVQMLASAVAKQEGFKYEPDEHIYWKQGVSSEKDFIFTTTQFITAELMDKIQVEMQPGESLLIACKSYQEGCENRHANISIKKIPHMLMGRCEYGKDDYSFNIVNMPVDEDVEPWETPEEANKVTSKKTNKPESQPGLFDNE